MLIGMDHRRIADLLEPYLGEESLTEQQIERISTYIDLLLKWNARMNLTAVRNPEQIVQRHFGESLFAARLLLRQSRPTSVCDVGSGAGFPGLPLKLYAPELQVTLIEAHGKKATFLREVIRIITLTDINVFNGRAESWGQQAELVTLRAVEKFESVLPVAAGLVAPGGRLALLIGSDQIPLAHALVKGNWEEEVAIPGSNRRAVAALRV